MRLATLSLFLLATFARASEPMCGTSAENDLRVRALHERSREQVRLMDTPAATLRDGAFYLRNSDTITAGGRPFDLDNETLIFTPAANASYAIQRAPLQYREPAATLLHDFRNGPSTFVSYNLGFTFPAFGRSVTRIYVTAYNTIEFDEPVAETAMQFDDLEAAVHRHAVLSPLLLTARKPRYLEPPVVFAEQSADAVTVTWRSSANAPFGFDVQAELRSDGSILYSYRSLVNLRWGAVVISPGFDPATAARTALRETNDAANDIVFAMPEALRPMADLRHVFVSRVGNTDLFSVHMTVNAPINRAAFESADVLGYQVSIGNDYASVEITRDAVTVLSFTGIRYEVDGASARVDGNTVEIFGIRGEESASVRASTYYRPSNRVLDAVNLSTDFPAPARRVSSDLSSLAQSTTLPLPIAEAFVLGSFDPYTVWEQLQHQYALRDDDIDGVLMYQTFFTDMIFFAGAYATGGNAGVDGIASPTPTKGLHVPQSPTLMHMNQLNYGYFAAEQTASKVMLHEFGHRWLYFFSIMENGQAGRFLNPVSAHPAAYVHTPSAFRVYGDDESSVMGGAYFTAQGDGTYRAHAANQGYSWTDLYLMGLASSDEVTPWFYLAGTSLPKEYWPQEGIVTNGEKRNVTLSQVTAVHGPRIPSLGWSDRRFRVLFVLVTENGRDATDAEVATMHQWRELMKRNFAIATGGRGSLIATFVVPAKKRSLR